MQRSIDALRSLALPAVDSAQTSARRFSDGAEFRIEIPSVEGPKVLAAVLETADAMGCPVHRISQGSGIQMLSDADIREMARIGAERQIEVCLFVMPRANFDIGGQWSAPAGKMIQWQNRGAEQLRHCLDEIFRACDLGIRSVLLADFGLIQVVSDLRKTGQLPKSLIIKSSAVMAPANPASCALLEKIGANTINVATDLTVAQLAAIRQCVTVPIDIYVESPDGLGGFVRHHETPEMIHCTAPMYVKLGLRNSPDIYPCGIHLEATAIALGRERVRRSKLVFDLIAREYPGAKMSVVGQRQPDLAVPEL